MAISVILVHFLEGLVGDFLFSDPNFIQTTSSSNVVAEFPSRYGKKLLGTLIQAQKELIDRYKDLCRYFNQ